MSERSNKMNTGKFQTSEADLDRLAVEIESLVIRSDPLLRKQGLDSAHALALSAQPSAVQTLFKLTPMLIESVPQHQLDGFLRMWIKMYNGSTLVLHYPNFSQFADKLGPSEVDIANPRSAEFQNNIKSKTDKIQFFDDSYVSEESNIHEQKVSFKQIMFDIAEIEVIKNKISTTEPTPQKLEEYRNKMIAFQMNHDNEEKVKLRTSLGIEGIKIGERLQQSLEWCRHYLNSFMKLSNKEISFGQFQQQLRPESMQGRHSDDRVFSKGSFSGNVKVPNAILAESIQNSKSSYGTIHKSHGIALTLNRNSIQSVKKSMGSPLARSSQEHKFPEYTPHNFTPIITHSKQYIAIGPIKPVQYAPQMVILQQERVYPMQQGRGQDLHNYQVIHNQKLMPNDKPSSTKHFATPAAQFVPQSSGSRIMIESLVKPQLVVTKYKPNLVIEENKSGQMGSSIASSSPGRSRKRIFGQTTSPKANLNPKGYISPKNQTNSDGFKLSDFVSEKQKRKQFAEFGALHQTPEWIVTPFSDHFQSEDLFSRFRKTCLHKKSTLFKNNQIQVNCTVLRQTCQVLNVDIEYKNLSFNQKEVKITYNIAKSFKVIDHKNIKSKFLLKNETIHNYNLQIQQFPVRSCAIQMTIHSQRYLPIPLPITVTRFVKLEYIDRQQFFSKWNQFNNKHYYTAHKLLYSRKILNTGEMTFLFPEMTELGKKQNYSYDQFGCVGRYQYFDLEWLMVFAFNVDSLLTIQILCTRDVNQQQVQFLQYYLNNLTMLVERVQIE